MHVSVYSLKKVLYEDEAVSLNCKTRSGEITVLENHEPLISILEKGTIVLVDKNEKMHYINASSGFLEVHNNAARLIVEAE